MCPPGKGNVSTGNETVENTEEIGNAISTSTPNTDVGTDASTHPADNTVETNAGASQEEDYYTASRLERETMYSQMLESYQKILDSKTTPTKQKEAAQTEIKKINDTKNAIMITENLIKTKGFEDCIVYENDGSINAIIKKEQLKKEDTAQIQSIIAREMNAKIENIHIMTK